MFRGVAIVIFVLLLLPGCTERPMASLAGASFYDGDGPLTVELDVVPGLLPDPDAWDAFRTVLADLAGRPVHVTSTGYMAPTGGNHTWASLADIAVRTAHDHADLHVVYLDGHPIDSTTNDRVLARTSVAGDIFVFKEGFDDARGLVDEKTVSRLTQVERLVLLHELGHAFGLGVTIEPHAGRAYPYVDGHSTNPASVMYAKAPVDVGEWVTGPIAMGFDADDLWELAEARARR